MAPVTTASAAVTASAALGAATAATPAASAGPAAQVTAPLRILLGPDSNVCGITVPPSRAGSTGKKTGRKLGLIVWLHGGMRSQNREKGAAAHTAILPFIDPARYYVCSPSAFSGQEWLTPSGLAHVEGIITYMLAHYPIDVRDINLVGVSDGSLGVIAYSLQGKYSPNRRVLISTFPQIVIEPQNLAGQERFKTGTWDFFQGGHDRLFPVSQVLPVLQAWEKSYANAHLHYFPDGEHDFSFFAQNAGALLRGIFAKKTGG